MTRVTFLFFAAALGAACKDPTTKDAAQRGEVLEAPPPFANSTNSASDGEPSLEATIDEDGVVTIEGTPLLEDKAISARARAFHARAPQGRVVLHCRPAAVHGRAVRVVDLFHEADVGRVSVAPEPNRE